MGRESPTFTGWIDKINEWVDMAANCYEKDLLGLLIDGYKGITVVVVVVVVVVIIVVVLLLK